MIRSLLTLLITLLLGDVNAPKHDLRKTPNKQDRMKALNAFFERNFYIIAGLTIVFLLIMFVAVCFLLVGSCTDSGLTYNQMGRII